MPFASALQYLPQDWGRLAYRHRPAGAGRQPPVTAVLLHGLGGDLEDWREFVAALPDDWGLVMVDFRGHGKSSSPEAAFDLTDLAADCWGLMRHLLPGEFHLFGYGVGGLVAQIMAQTGPGGEVAPALRGLVLIESFATAGAKTAFKPGRYGKNLRPEQARRIQAKYFTTRDRFHVSFYDAFWGSVIFFDAREFLWSTPLSVNHIFGLQGRHPGTDEKLLLPIRSNIQLHWIPGGGHYLLQEQPQALAAKCRELLAGG